ncbi:MAG: helix-turn-helix transcriptional regulator [Bacilli bacterium]|nr:helix-turn-helix transcriptional regulator [Bacilli bacterium]
MDNKSLASVISSAREKLGISQRELSRRTGIDNNTVAKIEKGERNLILYL